MAKDFYEILGVNKNATESQLKSAYRGLAMKYHPDKQKKMSSKQREKAENTFKDIALAWDTLSDPKKKAEYDSYNTPQHGPYSNRQRSYGGSGGIDTESVFARFFSDDIFGDSRAFGHSPFHSSRGSNYVQTPAPFEQNLYVTLEQLYSGCVKKLKITRTRWHGNQQFREDHFCEVNVKPGWKDNTRITFNGQGDQLSPSAQPGSLVFTIKTKPHPKFQRDGANLTTRVTIPLVKALCGFQMKFQTIDNRILNIPINEIVVPEFRKSIVGEGMPNQKDGRARGNLIISFNVVYPTNLSDSKKRQLEEILAE